MLTNLSLIPSLPYDKYLEPNQSSSFFLFFFDRQVNIDLPTLIEREMYVYTGAKVISIHDKGISQKSKLEKMDECGMPNY